MKWLCRVLAGMTILIEVAFPLAMVSRWARRGLVPGMFLAQVFIYLMMGVAFTQFMFAYLFWVPWERIGAWVRGVIARRGSYAMLYDGGCGLCRSVASVVARLDVLRRIEPLDVLSDWPVISARFQALRQDRCLIDMHVVGPDRTVYTRYRAYRALAWAMPATWPLLPLLYLPGVPLVGDRIYGRVASSRHDAGCSIA
jgi:predicted DCC family thiol-disulfide oxidoreductase YuxK